MKPSRPSAWRSVPSRASCFSTTFWVAIPAWSVPGIHSAFFPSMRAKRVRISCRVLLRMCPMWSTPVTFGGGITIENAGRGSFSSAWK
jgi:hypothetical protein